MGGRIPHRRTWTVLLVSLTVALGAFAALSVKLLVQVRSLRSELGRNLTMISAADATISALERNEGLAPALASLESVLKEQPDSDAVAHFRLARARHVSDDEASRGRLAAAVDELIEAARHDNNRIRDELGGAWTALCVATIAALAFAGAGIALTAVARLQSARLMAISTERRAERRHLFEDRTEALVAVARGMAHEINNPLAFVVSNVTHVQAELSERGALDPELKEIFAETAQGLNRIRDVVAELRRATGGTALDRAVDITQSIESSAWLLRHFIASRAVLSVDLQKVPRATISASDLSLALTQLVTALVEPLPENPPERPAIVLRTAPAEGHSRLEIEVGTLALRPRLDSLVSAETIDGPLGEGARAALELLERAGARLSVREGGTTSAVLEIALPSAASE